MSELYPLRHETFSREIFQNPPAEYRGVPFWSWNTRLDLEQLFRQIAVFKEMGFGGAHIHPRTGLATEYLSKAFLDVVDTCVRRFEAEDLRTWLYDEDRWPSGFAGGLVTQCPEYRLRYLLFTPHVYGSKEAHGPSQPREGIGRNEKGVLLARYEIQLAADGSLAHYRVLGEGECVRPGARAWFAYLETSQAPCAWFNNQTYVDTLNPDAIKKFIEVTHERYYTRLGEKFGGSIPGIFTDEPQFAHKRFFSAATSDADVIMPFTPDFLESYEREYGEDLLQTLPEVFWELSRGAYSRTRYRFHLHICERFSRAFCDQVGRWCQQHDIMFTGHMMEEPTLHSQTAAVGDVMRAYEHFQLPGIDMLCASMELTTAKQAQSAARQYGRPGVLSELYGVSGWDYTFAGHKQQGDWQAALGVTVRVHHLAWVSMAGEAKRDYPGSIFYQSPWWKEYRVVEEHFARVNYAMTRGRPVTLVAVVHPVESYWLCCGPAAETISVRNELEENFQNITHWLLYGLQDFDFISESLLPRQKTSASAGRLAIGAMTYDLVLVPGLKTIRASTVCLLEEFAAAGGRVVFLGEVPAYVDALPSGRAQELARRSTCIPFSRARLLQTLSGDAEIRIRNYTTGEAANTLLYQLREDGDERYLFICNTALELPAKNMEVQIKGRWEVILLDTVQAGAGRMATRQEGGFTVFRHDFSAHGHLLLRLTTGALALPAVTALRVADVPTQLCACTRVSLDEPNVLLLDQAAWRYNGGAWQEPEELLRLENKVRDLAGIPQRNGGISQPWAQPADTTPHGEVQLLFPVDVRHAVRNCELALEAPANFTVELDGAPLALNDRGWWVDECIRRIPLPELSCGIHHLLLTCPASGAMALEWLYLLGDFGVGVSGRCAYIVPPVKNLAFGDWRAQGLPFYSGNVTYHCKVTTARSQQILRVPHFSGTMVSVDERGRRLGVLAFAPYELLLEGAGVHELALTLWGNRENSFGCLHRVSKNKWVGPGEWRTSADEWAYEYQNKPMGILSAPRIHILES